MVAFIDTHLGNGPEGLPPTVATFPTTCGAKGPNLPLTDDSWDTIVRPSPVTFTPGPLDRVRTTSSSSSDIEEEMHPIPRA